MASRKETTPSKLTNDFVHLRAMSSMSMVKSLVSVDDIIELSEKDDMKAVAITDVQRMFGTIKHFKHAQDKHLKAIVGVEVLIKPDAYGKKYAEDGTVLDESLPEYTQGIHEALLLCNSEQSYKYLMKLVSDSWVKNQVDKRPYILESDLLKIKEEASLKDGDDMGFAVLLGGRDTWMGKQLSIDEPQPAFRNSVEYVEWMKSLFGEKSVYIELQRIAHNEVEAQKEYNWINRSIAVSNKTKLDYVATHPFMFIERKDWFAHEIRVQNAVDLVAYTGETTYATPEQHWLTTEEMKERFSDLPKAIKTAERLGQELGNHPPLLGKYFLPDFPIPENAKIDFEDLKEGSKIRERLESMYLKIPESKFEGMNEEEKEHEINLTRLLTRKSWDGFLERMQENQPFKDDPSLKKVYMDRFFYETEMIVSMGFTGYFLIVSDFIQWSKANDIPVGPGRGSGAGSLVAWSLKITDLDPIPYGLIFERFLNPERVSMPDFDVDFCQYERGRVIEYVKEKYGRDKVGQIATVSTAKAKKSLGVVGKVIDAAPMTYKDLSSMVPLKPVDITLSTCLEESKRLKHEYRTNAVSKQIIDLAKSLEGTPVNPGKGAAGLVISPTTLADFSPLYVDQKILNEYSDTDDAPLVCQYNKEDIETAGLVKFDFLGLATLTILKLANKYVNMGPEKLNLAKLNLKDDATYRLISDGMTVGVFQIESQKMQALMRDIKPNKLEEIIALIALYRPGPMDLIPTFAARKKGEEPVEYPDPRVEAVLKETYGVMVYQEQVMQMSQIVGGYTLGGADLLRRAMGKKKMEEMVKHRAIFREGALKNGIDNQKADHIFDMMEKFAGYGFNKSHAAAYALITFQTAYMKTHHPAAFYAGCMTIADDPEKVAKFRRDAEKYMDYTKGGTPVNRPITLLAPDINYSPDVAFAPSERNPDSIEYSLNALKGINSLSVKFIVAEREENGKFASLEDFVKRTYKKLSMTTFRALIGSGALDSLIPSAIRNIENSKPWTGREWLTENMPVILDYCKQLKKETSKTPGGTIKVPKLNAEDLLALQGDLLGDLPMKPKRKSTRKTATKVVKEVVWPEDKFITPEKVWTEVEAMAKENVAIGYEFSGSIANYYQKLFSDADGGGLSFSNMDQLIKDNTENRTGWDFANKHMIQGVPVEVRTWSTRKGLPMAGVLLDDGVNLYDVVVFNSAIETLPTKLEKMPWVAINCGIPYDKDGKAKKEEKEKAKARAVERLKVKAVEEFDSSEEHVEMDDADERETQDFSIAAVDFYTESSLFERWASSVKISHKANFDKVVSMLTPYASSVDQPSSDNIAIEFSGTDKVAYIVRDYGALKELLNTIGEERIRVNMRPLKVKAEFSDDKKSGSSRYGANNQGSVNDEDSGVGAVSNDVVNASKNMRSNVLLFKDSSKANQAVKYQKNVDIESQSSQYQQEHDEAHYHQKNPVKNTTKFKPRINR